MKSWNNRGWIRIVEAFIAIIILIGAALLIISEQPKNTDISSQVYAKESSIIDYVSNNESLRNQILNGDTSGTNAAIGKIITGNFAYTTNICDITSICNQNVPYDRDVYSKEVIISSNLSQYSPKKLVFSVWAK